MSEKSFDRTTEDLGNIVNLGHVNVTVPDQTLATAFYISALGLTRDPYMVTGTGNMWANIGMSQFHLPTRGTQVLRGVVGLVIPNREALLERLAAAKKELSGTKYKFRETNEAVEVTCPWGNRYDVHVPDTAAFGRMRLGIGYVELLVPKGAAEPIGRFYSEIMGARVQMTERKGKPCAAVTAGEAQHLYYREAAKVPEYEGDHIQIYIANMSGPHAAIKDKSRITSESSSHQFNFEDIVDPDSGKTVYTFNHEVRSLLHPMYGRPLVNRNPLLTMRNYEQGLDAVHWTTA